MSASQLVSEGFRTTWCKTHGAPWEDEERCLWAWAYEKISSCRFVTVYIVEVSP